MTRKPLRVVKDLPKSLWGELLDLNEITVCEVKETTFKKLVDKWYDGKVIFDFPVYIKKKEVKK